MKKLITSIFAAAVTLAAGAALAQHGDSEKMMTYTGCLQAGDQPGHYMLTHVMKPKSDSSDAASSKAPPKMLGLSGDSAKIAMHSGEMVTVMGHTMMHDNSTMMDVMSIKKVAERCE